MMNVLHSFHEVWGYVAIVANALAGLLILVAYRVRKFSGRPVWAVTIGAEIAMLIQVLTGAILVSTDYRTVPRFHMFYGYVAFITIGMAFCYRRSLRDKKEFWYGLVGLF